MDGLLVPPGAAVESVAASAGQLTVLHAEARNDAAARGTVPPVLLVHGGGADSSSISWYHLFEPLGRVREVWAIDMPGFGGSMDVEPVGGPDSMADLIAEVAKRLGIGPAVVVGVSMGGDVAFASRWITLMSWRGWSSSVPEVWLRGWEGGCRTRGSGR